MTEIKAISYGNLKDYIGKNVFVSIQTKMIYGKILIITHAGNVILEEGREIYAHDIGSDIRFYDEINVRQALINTK